MIAGNSLSRGAGAVQPPGGERPPRELLHKGENYTPTLVTLLLCSFDVLRPLLYPRVRTSGVGCAPDTATLIRVIHEIGEGEGPDETIQRHIG